MPGAHQVGVTLIPGRGGYHPADRTILYSVVPRRNVAVLKKTVLQKDPSAFMAFMTADDVMHADMGNQPHW